MPKKKPTLPRADPDDAPLLTDAFFDRSEIQHGDKVIRRGRPPLPNPKRAVKLRLDFRYTCRLSRNRRRLADADQR